MNKMILSIKSYYKTYIIRHVRKKIEIRTIRSSNIGRKRSHGKKKKSCLDLSDLATCIYFSSLNEKKFQRDLFDAYLGLILMFGTILETVHTGAS